SCPPHQLRKWPYPAVSPYHLIHLEVQLANGVEQVPGVGVGGAECDIGCRRPDIAREDCPRARNVSNNLRVHMRIAADSIEFQALSALTDHLLAFKHFERTR